MLDWSNVEAKVSKHFTVEECLLLLRWRRLADEHDGLTDEIKANLEKACQVFDKVRDFLGCPIHVHSFYRPPGYSAIVGGSDHDVHTMGIALDFDCGSILSCDEVKGKLAPELERLGIRMEKGTGNWVHIDIRGPGPSGRYFTP